jgi:Zn ribbon nucleic-acid-binding protein
MTRYDKFITFVILLINILVIWGLYIVPEWWWGWMILVIESILLVWAFLDWLFNPKSSLWQEKTLTNTNCFSCGKHEKQIKKMIKFNQNVQICNECIDISSDLIHKEDKVGIRNY